MQTPNVSLIKQFVNMRRDDILDRWQQDDYVPFYAEFSVQII